MQTSSAASARPDAAGHGQPLPGVQRQSVVCFEYTGRTGLTAIGPVSGKRYRFDYPGARAFVDLRDRLALAVVPHLRQVRMP